MVTELVVMKGKSCWSLFVMEIAVAKGSIFNPAIEGLGYTSSPASGWCCKKKSFLTNAIKAILFDVTPY